MCSDNPTQIIHTAIYCTDIALHSDSHSVAVIWTTRTGQWTLVGLKPLKAWLEDMFDHKLALDENDPQLERLKELEKHDLAEVRIFDGVGAEMFAKHAFDFADKLIREQTDGRCFVESVECMEHGANSAIYTRK